MKPRTDALAAPVYRLPTGKIEIKLDRPSEITSALRISESEKRRASKVLAEVLKRTESVGSTSSKKQASRNPSKSRN
jgi:hypothetical protein